MARFIGSDLNTGNWAEDFFIQKLLEYFDFDDSYIIYRNRIVFGTEFDVALLIPDCGIVIFEVKGWVPDTILNVENGDKIVIRTKDGNGAEGEKRENPYAQARGYMFHMERRIRSKTNKDPLIYVMTCFPNLTVQDYLNKGMEPVCEPETTLLKEDLSSREAFHNKMELCRTNQKRKAHNKSPFTKELMYSVRQIFEGQLKIEDPTVEDTNLVEGTDPPGKPAYSILANIPHDSSTDEQIRAFANAYAQGTKLHLFVSAPDDLVKVRDAVNGVLHQKGLIASGGGLQIDFQNTFSTAEPSGDGTFFVFHCSAYLLPESEQSREALTVTDGVIRSEAETAFLQYASDHTLFNKDQFRAEHCDIRKNVIVRAGAGTGKTYTMISRIAYICHMQNCSLKDMSSRIVMMTFTDEAADQMENKIKEYFNNLYLLTGNRDCLDFINMIEGMQISTIHSYALRLISLLGIEAGYGKETSLSNSSYRLKQIVAEKVNDYIVRQQKKRGAGYVEQLGMPIYLINKNILSILKKLHDQSINAAELEPANFGLTGRTGDQALHELLSCVIPEIEQAANEADRDENRISLSNTMSLLSQCIHHEENRRRLIRMQTGRPQYMFIDEFQDTDDTQIDAVKKIAELLQYKLFVVGDIKQCIYRFRGATENAFEQLHGPNDPKWEHISLVKNYRTDSDLLDLFHNTFSAMGRQYIKGERLLPYGPDTRSANNQTSGEAAEGDQLIGTRHYHTGVSTSEFYRRVSFAEEAGRMDALFGEIERQKALIEAAENRLSGKEREIAVLVRENWQADMVKREGKARGIDIITNTGGDLYTTEPALDMLTLLHALIHYDEADYLFAFVSSNFISGGGKAQMYLSSENSGLSADAKAKEPSQAEKLLDQINQVLSGANDEKWKSWEQVIKSLRTMPVLQVLRKLYQICRPWVGFDPNSAEKQAYYRLNVELLFEELIQTSSDSVSVNSLAQILKANIISRKNVDSRSVETDGSSGLTVRCITVHKSKGLEYGSVILPFCSFPIDRMKNSDINVTVSQKPPVRIGYQMKPDKEHGGRTFQNDYFNKSEEEGERMREESRVLYVAMTRAIHSFSWLVLENKNGKNWQNLIWEGC